jgi:hypothetical protein
MTARRDPLLTAVAAPGRNTGVVIGAFAPFRGANDPFDDAKRRAPLGGRRVIDISRAICRTRDGVRAAASVCPGGPRRSRISSGWRRRFPCLSIMAR